MNGSRRVVDQRGIPVPRKRMKEEGMVVTVDVSLGQRCAVNLGDVIPKSWERVGSLACDGIYSAKDGISIPSTCVPTLAMLTTRFATPINPQHPIQSSFFAFILPSGPRLILSWSDTTSLSRSTRGRSNQSGLCHEAREV
jgi:hypothetical protein